jgi:hypothetical protein
MSKTACILFVVMYAASCQLQLLERMIHVFERDGPLELKPNALSQLLHRVPRRLFKVAYHSVHVHFQDENRPAIK